jgi:hypothetical protein
LPAPPFAYADNYLIDLKAAIILDVNAAHAHTHHHGSWLISDTQSDCVLTPREEADSGLVSSFSEAS